MNQRRFLNQKRIRRAARTRAKVFGVSSKPRLVVFRSSRYVYAQLIDDAVSHTVSSASGKELKNKGKSKIEEAKLVGELLAKRATELGIKSAIFDRRAYKYHGRVKALADGARNGGLRL